MHLQHHDPAQRVRAYIRHVPRQPQTGFTLLELLVATTLLSMIMLGLSGALRTMAQTETRVDERLQRMAEIRAVQHFVAHTFSRVPAEKWPVPDAPGQLAVAFQAAPDSLVWLGVLPARPDVGGRHFFRLALEGDAGSPQLVLRLQAASAQAWPTDWSQTEARVIARGVQVFRVQAQGLPAGRQATEPVIPGWIDGWPQSQYLPEQLRLDVTDQRGAWPLWIVPVTASSRSDDGIAITVIGGGSR